MLPDELKRTRAANDVAEVCNPFERPTSALMLAAVGVASNANWNVPVWVCIGWLYQPVVDGKSMHTVTADLSTPVRDSSGELPEQPAMQTANDAATVLYSEIFMSLCLANPEVHSREKT